ncbi:MAG: 4-hydroxythreonine-4-phosphate dehydrogenase PdxA [Eubacteriales bacterium]|nr:4-hydroxythreonine-4-phosphate dehydrogenase PdxA [Eubacteriales bacterium]
MAKPIIAVPMGDPAGIGPEIVVRAVADVNLQTEALIVVIGDRRMIAQAMQVVGITLSVHLVSEQLTDNNRLDIFEGPGILNLIDLNNADPTQIVLGEINGSCGRAAFDYIEKSIALAQAHLVDAVATTPINKESLKAGQIPFIGHTEIFAELTGTDNPLTLFEVRNLRVFFLSRHVSLRQACDLVTTNRLVTTSHKCLKVMQQMGLAGALAIAGLNPHSGEHGLFGEEEGLAIVPAVAQLQAEGYNVVGPIGADSVFHLALQGQYAAVLSLYHDQGHIATKTLDFERTIAITAGLPFLRTSVDHGTAFNIAGQGIASPVSMIEAIRLAARYAPNYRQ